MNESSNGLSRVLVITNVIMAAAICILVAREMFDEPGKAYAGGGAAGGKYIAVSMSYTRDREALMVIDTSSNVMIAYNLDARGDKIYPSSGRTIDQDFQLVTKLKDNYFTGGSSSNKQYFPRSIRASLVKRSDSN